MTEDKCPACNGVLELKIEKGVWGKMHLVCIGCKRGWLKTEKYINAINIIKESNKTLISGENDGWNDKI